MQPVKRHSIARLIVSLVMLCAAVWVVWNRQYVIDQIAVWRYAPTAEVASIAQRATLRPAAQFLFYASEPAVYDRDNFNNSCHQLVEKTAVLGCYSSRRIYIYNVTDSRLDGIKEVTAAHEMLHAAYDRLSDAERQRVDALITQQAKTINNAKLTDRLKLYDATEPGERLNELHSIFGSEISSLSPELETYYSQYFSNRSAVVALSNSYESVFDEIETKQKTLVADMNTLADGINSDTNRYSSLLAQLQSDISSFNARADRGEFSNSGEFNTGRSALLARQSSLSSLRLSINGRIAEYNQKKQELDDLNVQAAGLQKSIDSTSLPEAPTL